MNPGALDGVRVLELSRYIAAPVAGKALGELGADVIKIEDPDKGDPMRYWQSGDRDHSPQFAAYNRTKRGITLDLKHDRGKEAFLRLVDTADVVIENFRPGVMARLGLGWDVLADRNPRLVYCSISGFGEVGPYVDRPAYDTVISAMGGLYSQILDPDRPQPVGPAFSDLLAGMFAVQAILAALYARTNTGRGQYADASMLRAVMGFLVEPGSNRLDMGEVTSPTTRQRRAQAHGLVASDGLAFVVHMSVPEKFWIATTDAFGIPELRGDPRFADRDGRHDHYSELGDALRAAAARRTRAEWFEILAAADIPHAPINGFDSIFEDPQVEAMGIVEEIEMPDGARPLAQVGPPFRLSSTPLRVSPPAPGHGEHTDQVLADLGFSAADIQAMAAEGVI
ncbi:MAG: CoA transferase [Acidimicrobiia bacterium]|nr:CoA transferase [Acidimicrobiia bacterium]MDH4309972.1 CoA transferase [Acidimicrobiia bacterium]